MRTRKLKKKKWQRLIEESEIVCILTCHQTMVAAIDQEKQTISANRRGNKVMAKAL